jgi:symplekin
MQQAMKKLLFTYTYNEDLTEEEKAMNYSGSATSLIRPPLSRPEMLLMLHSFSQNENMLKNSQMCLNMCFENKTVFNDMVIAGALNQMIEITPLPRLFLYTLLMGMQNFPSLQRLAAEQMLIRLIQKQIWTQHPQLWEGFLLCCRFLKRNASNPLFNLPRQQLFDAFEWERKNLESSQGKQKPQFLMVMKEYIQLNPSMKQRYAWLPNTTPGM